MRRAQQIHTRAWVLNVDGALTGPQFAVLTALGINGPLDQVTLGEKVSLDRSTMADVARRLEKKGWLTRSRDAADGRRRVLELSPAGILLLDQVTPRVEQLGEDLLAALSPLERRQLLDLLTRVIAHGERVMPGDVTASP
jgi:DNA-binding MarR family transcriptional regulator